MGKKILKYTTIFSALAFFSSTDVGKDARISVGPVQLNPSKVIEPIEDIYKDVKKIIKKKRKR
jgi:hypothetical protein